MRPLVQLAFFLVCVATLLGACASAPRALPPGAPRLDVVRGQTLVIPMDESWPASIGGTRRVKLDDGTEVAARVMRIEVTVGPAPASEEARRDRWLPLPGVWLARDQAVSSPRPPSELRAMPRVLVLDRPTLSRSRSLSVAGKDFALNWLPDPGELVAPRQPALGVIDDPWTPAVGAAGAVSPILTSLAWPESQTPIGRWRYRMLTGTLRPSFDPRPRKGDGPPRDAVADEPPTDIQAFEDQTIEALARQNESRWRIAMAVLWAIDPELSSRLKRRLAAAVDFGNGFVAPAWPTDHAAIDKLLVDILDPRLDSAQISLRVEAWLATQPPAISWVVDDAGTLDAITGLGIGTVGVANLSDLSTLCWISRNQRESLDLKPLPPCSARRLLVEPMRDEPGSRPGETARTIGVHAGKWIEQQLIRSDRVAVMPPGLRVGPLLPDYVMSSWLDHATPSPVRADRACVAMVHRPVADGPWELFVECMAPMDQAIADNDVVRLWFGPLGSPLSVLRIDARGVVADEARRADLVMTPPDVRVIRAPDRWTFRLSIPSPCIERDGVLRLGLSRVDVQGNRFAWPRPMLPWQEEPGRIVLDLTRWGIN